MKHSVLILATILASALLLGLLGSEKTGMEKNPPAQSATTNVEVPAESTPAVSESVSEEESPTMTAARLGFCVHTCDPCITSSSCPQVGGRPQACMAQCY
ncbi:hypothetical protein [Haliangium ochraceum]|uniref:Uncharacterized protein n=1 Tax=Haliangium ochraceum (strain DSM 14365 / JCM 11303 / SMP-2) TaxID=502025 RepID=D0LUP9_HALO1|nr:hypothetical protein [Haliangium ochraceum]ACY13939.1 hypothetical protein Hoch_1385 [Haliangium ochraceum DSM 14365]